jgi:hypothetical protein
MSASVDVDYRIYVGNASLSMPTASGGMGEQAVFASYAGVYFPGVDTRDWTAGGRTLTAVNTPTTNTSGYEGITAAEYNGTDEYHKYEGTQAVTNWPLTQEVLMYTDRITGADQTIMALSDIDTGSFSEAWPRVLGASFAYLKGYVQGASGSASNFNYSAQLFAINTWYYVGLTRDANTGTSRTWRDGTQRATDTTTLTAPTFDRFAIGTIVNSTATNGNFFLDGRVAVALLSSSVRSADYMSTMQDNWAGTMYTAGAWTANDSDVVAGSTGWVLFQTIGQSTSAAADWTNTADALVDDANTAECTLDDTGVFESEYLNFTNPAYGTTIPTGAPSYTIEFRIKRMSDTASAREVQDLTVQFIDDTGTRVGDNEADTITDWPSALGTVDYIVSGLTPDGTEFTSAAGMALRATGVNTNGATLTEVATAWMRVSWTGTDAAYNTRGFFALME